MIWGINYLPEADEDLAKLDSGTRILVRKAIKKTQTNPLPANEGGYGKPLGNKGNRNLTGLLKIKLKNSGIRIVYKLVRQEDKMLIIVIGLRENEKVYDTAARRIEKHNL